MSKIPTDIGQSLGNEISDLCPFSMANDKSKNHCAHYVSHIMGYELPGVTCKNATWADKQQEARGATIRVNDLFAASSETGALSKKPTTLQECLVFVTISTNMKNFANKLKMNNHPKKHVGILTDGKVWNYSNSQNKVVADSLTSFKTKFTHAYLTAGATVEFYYGKFI
jgi:hypothetical protein